MRIIKTSVQCSEMDLSLSELVIIFNALRAVLKEIDEWEFVARIGVEKSEALALARSLYDHINAVEPIQNE